MGNRTDWVFLFSFKGLFQEQKVIWAMTSQKPTKVAYALCNDSDQPMHSPSLTRALLCPIGYRIYPDIRPGFVPIEWLQISISVLWNFAIRPNLPFLNNPKDLDPSYKTDLDLWDCFGRKKTPSHNRRNTVAKGLSYLLADNKDSD